MGLKIEHLAGDGGDYPLIRIYGRDPAAVGGLIAGIKSLSSSAPAALHTINGMEAVNCSLSAVISERDPGGIRSNGNDNSFTWVLSEQRRRAVLGLLDPFGAPSPYEAFQWLSGPQAPGDADGGIGLVITTDELGRW